MAQLVPPDVYEERMSVCRECHLFRNLSGGICSGCGCFMTIKARAGATVCPLGKWGSWAEET